jgi:hypothetical protein
MAKTSIGRRATWAKQARSNGGEARRADAQKASCRVSDENPGFSGVFAKNAD